MQVMPMRLILKIEYLVMPKGEKKKSMIKFFRYLNILYQKFIFLKIVSSLFDL